MQLHGKSQLQRSIIGPEKSHLKNQQSSPQHVNVSMESTREEVTEQDHTDQLMSTVSE